MKNTSKRILKIILFIILFQIPIFWPFLMIYLFVYIIKKIINGSKNISINSQTYTPTVNNSVTGIELKCAKCGNVLAISDKVCSSCQTPFDGNNVTVEMNPDAIIQTPGQEQTFVNTSDFDPMFALPEAKLVEKFIEKELLKSQIDKNEKLIPSDALKKKKIFNLIFCLLVFIYISLIFFHFPLLTYIVGLIILIIFFKMTRNYNLMKYLKKQLKARPSEKVSNIVMNTKTSLVTDNSIITFIVGILLSILLPMIIFINPIILYEKMDNGYGVRYYIFGLTNFKTATIPEKYNNKNVVSLRGNTFSNMPLLKEVYLPDTITEIRGQAFKNNKSLTSIKLPSNLEYLGGGAFYNCTKLKYIKIPDTVTYIGGEAFYNAKSLKLVTLSNNITEIRGSTFENCSSLESITIPDGVTRIGGHAFYGNSSLSKVTISENSKLKEIGSSAFRKCNSLYEITLPAGVYVNSRAFKESPTKIKNLGLFDPINYSNESFIYISLNQTEKINRYKSNARLQDAYITLENVTKNNDFYEFTLKYNDNNITKTFTLTTSKKYEIVHENLVIQIEDDYVFENSYNRVSLYAYYN